MKVQLLLELLKNSGLLSEVGTLQSVSISFIIPLPSSFYCERYLWVCSWQLLNLKCIFQSSSSWNYFCLVLWYDQIHRRKDFLLITFLCIFDNPHKYIKFKYNPHSTAKKCLDTYRLKKVCLNVLLNHAIGLELNVYRFGPLDFLFF